MRDSAVYGACLRGCVTIANFVFTAFMDFDEDVQNGSLDDPLHICS